MVKLMLVSPTALDEPPGGRAQLAQLHRRCLRQLFGPELLVHELTAQPTSAWQRLAGFVDGLSPSVVRAVADRVRAEQIDFVYLDGSNLGRLAPEIKRVSPRTQVLTFFHNVEARFFLGSLRTEKNLHALGVLAANFRAERDAVRHSDRLITLSERDKAGIRRLYGRAGTDILPLSIEDKLPPAPAEPAVHGARDYCLFVGGAFYANLAGIRWFARNVSPHIGLDTVVVGRGFDALRPELERHSGVKVIGEADDLARWYAGAKVVIAPIFDGSGMKTKTAEALMFGKKVVGTSEAFSGYEAVADQAGWVCNSREEFATTLRSLEAGPLKQFDPELRQLYVRDHSYEAAHRRLSGILA